MSEAATDTEVIERELDKTRARMDKRLDEIGERMSPGQLLDDLMKQFHGSDGGAFANDLVQSIRANPLPAALTGIGLAWLMASNPKPAHTAASKGRNDRWASREELDRDLHEATSRLTREASEDDLTYTGRLNAARGSVLGLSRGEDESHETFAQKVETALTEARDRVARLGQNIADGVGSLAGTVSEAAQEGGERLAQAGRAVPKLAGDVYSAIGDSPVLLGSIGVAVGAMLGAAIPLSQVEQEALSGVASNVRSAASTAAHDAGTAVAAAADSALQAGTESLREHGLTGDKSLSDIAAEAKSGKLIDDLKEVAGEAVKGIDLHVEPSSRQVGSATER